MSLQMLDFCVPPIARSKKRKNPFPDADLLQESKRRPGACPKLKSQTMTDWREKNLKTAKAHAKAMQPSIASIFSKV